MRKFQCESSRAMSSNPMTITTFPVWCLGRKLCQQLRFVTTVGFADAVFVRTLANIAASDTLKTL